MPVETTAPAYEEMAPSWQKCRDAYEGQEAIIARGADYVTPLDTQTPTEYVNYLRRGLFFNATARTVQGMVGASFRRPPSIEAGAADDLLSDATLTDLPFDSVAKMAMREVLTVGRYGLLCDYSDEENRPYLVPYLAENIINWRVERIGGRSVVTMVALAESGHVADPNDPFKLEDQHRIRVLALEDGIYSVRVYVKVTESTGGNRERYVLVEELYPTISGANLEYIPFICINSNTVGLDVDRPPLLDLVDVNLHHWRLSCDYNHGLHYTGLPTPVAAGFPKSNEGYRIGPGAAWWSEDKDAKASFLEFKGEGLGAMRDALSEDEAKMAALGGRLLEKPKHAAEAAAAIRLRTAGDQATLAGITESLDRGLTQALGLLNAWLGVYPEGVEVILNKDFFGEQMDAAQALKLMQIAQQGYMSVDNLMFLYDRGELLRPGVEPQEERELIELQQSIQSVMQAEG